MKYRIKSFSVLFKSTLASLGICTDTAYLRLTLIDDALQGKELTLY